MIIGDTEIHTRIGAISDLQLEISWRFRFIGPGNQVAPATDIVWIDTGGHCASGIIDHHGSNQEKTCAAMLVVNRADFVHEHLVGPWLSAARTTQVVGLKWKPTIVTHFAPDFDAIAASLLAIEMVEKGGFPKWGESLAHYALDVDQGRSTCRKKLNSAELSIEPDLHMLILVMTNLDIDCLTNLWSVLKDSPTVIKLSPVTEPANDKNLQLLLSGISIVHEACSRANGVPLLNGGFAENILNSIHSAIGTQDWFGRAITILNKELALDFEKFVKVDQPAIEECDIKLPTYDGIGMRTSPAAFVLKPTESKCDKYYIRAFGGKSGKPRELTVISKSTADGIKALQKRFHTIISVDPVFAEKTNQLPVNLAGLGAELERNEQLQRKKLDVSDLKRHGNARYKEVPNIADPWYDGRDHDFTIVDGPRDPSVLSPEQIVSLVQDTFWIPWIDNCRSWSFSANDIDFSSHLALNERNTQSARRLSSNPDRPHTESFSIYAGTINHSWGEASVARSIASVCGRDYQALGTPDFVIYCGFKGAIVHSLIVAAENHVESLDACWIILEEWQRVQCLLKIGVRINKSEATLSSLKRDFLVRSQDPRSTLFKSKAKFLNPPLREKCWEVFHTRRLTESISQMLDQRDEVEQRALAAALNWIVVTLALVGVIQTLVAVADYLGQKDKPSPIPIIQLLTDQVALNGGLIVASIVAAGLIIATIRYKKILTKSIPFKQATNENTEELLR